MADLYARGAFPAGAYPGVPTPGQTRAYLDLCEYYRENPGAYEREQHQARLDADTAEFERIRERDRENRRKAFVEEEQARRERRAGWHGTKAQNAQLEHDERERKLGYSIKFNLCDYPLQDPKVELEALLCEDDEGDALYITIREGEDSLLPPGRYTVSQLRAFRRRPS